MSNRLEEIKSRILSISDLPTLPTVATEVMSLADDPDTSINDLVEVIHNDPSITGKILRIANSAFYGMRQKIDTISRALVVLGMNEVNNLVTSISVFSAFPQSSDKESFNREKFWEHCAVTGEVSKAISNRLGLKAMGVAFTSGLLHDIGKIILDQYFHDEFMDAFSMSKARDIPLFEAEREIFGVNHSQIGGWLGEKWRLPPNLIDAITFHHKPMRSLNHKITTSIVSLANIFSKASDNSFSGEELKIILTDTEAWKILERELPAILSIDIERFTFELEEYSRNAKEFLKIVTG
ncbi:MAG: HDOD domain-containing protein [Candidatus Delongbacteria bacterium]|nr:HDOD domain-containing protein [Candidatus Delongbacteria bacterium]MBN2834414.1 HDOD domain-containing protein [Candidatus Delongbacteria bacterium]